MTNDEEISRVDLLITELVFAAMLLEAIIEEEDPGEMSVLLQNEVRVRSEILKLNTLTVQWRRKLREGSNDG